MHGRRALIAALVLLFGARRRDRRAPSAAAHTLLARRPRKGLRLHPERDRDRQVSGRDPAAPAARQAGLLREFRRPRCRDRNLDERGHDLPPLFDVEADHVSHGDDAGRGGQAFARRSRLEIHSGLCRHEGRRREEGRGRQGCAGAGAAGAPGHDQGSDAPHRRACPTAIMAAARSTSSMPTPICSTAIFDQRRIRREDRRAAAGRAARHGLGLRPFHRRARPRHRGDLRKDAAPVREGAAARSARDDRDRVLCRRSRQMRRASPSRCRTDRIDQSDDAGPRSSGGRGDGNPAAAAWSARSATTPASRRCC